MSDRQRIMGQAASEDLTWDTSARIAGSARWGSDRVRGASCPAPHRKRTGGLTTRNEHPADKQMTQSLTTRYGLSVGFPALPLAMLVTSCLNDARLLRDRDADGFLLCLACLFGGVGGELGGLVSVGRCGCVTVGLLHGRVTLGLGGGDPRRCTVDRVMARGAINPATTGLPDDWWTAGDCARFLGISVATWRAYVSRGQAPTAERRFGRSPAWQPETVKAWAAGRPGSGRWSSDPSRQR